MIITGKFKPYANGKTVGFLNLNLDNLVFLNYSVIMQSPKGLWIARPQRKVKEEYKDIYFFKKELTEMILDKIGDGMQEVEIRIDTTGDVAETSDDGEAFPF